MEAYLLEWLNLLVRWAHLVVGIAWIGASFYFIWLDNHLEPSADPRLAGELWAIHGGGFYNARKYRLGPERLPPTLHWFKWEAYWTWITGFALLVLMYYANAELYLIDPAVMPLSKAMAIGISLATLVGGYAVYEGLCRSPLAKNDNLLAAALLLLLALTAWGLAQVFSGRGAFIHYGAILGTIMAANVAHIIIPGQRRMVEAIRAGPRARRARRPDGKAAQRPQHLLHAAGGVHDDRRPLRRGLRQPLELARAGRAHARRRAGAGLVRDAPQGTRAVMGARCRGRVCPRCRRTPGPGEEGRDEKPVSFLEVRKIVDARCVSCHAEKPSFQGLAEAPKGVRLDTPERISAQAAAIYQQSVLARAMPPGNLTGLTEEERRLLERWYRAR